VEVNSTHNKIFDDRALLDSTILTRPIKQQNNTFALIHRAFANQLSYTCNNIELNFGYAITKRILRAKQG
jgi:hypothetical protein